MRMRKMLLVAVAFLVGCAASSSPAPKAADAQSIMRRATSRFVIGEDAEVVATRLVPEDGAFIVLTPAVLTYDGTPVLIVNANCELYCCTRVPQCVADTKECVDLSTCWPSQSIEWKAISSPPAPSTNI